MNKDLKEAQRVFHIEKKALDAVLEGLGSEFSQAVDLLCSCRGKVVVSGMGKSGHIGRKLAATLSSTGTPALFLHPAESSHGDMGVLTSQDVLILISYGGGSQELNDLLNFTQRKGLSLIGLSGNSESPLAQYSSVFLNIAVPEEACPLGLAPTASSTAALVLGDALAMACLNRKGFRKENFAEFHPGGRIGRRLLTKVTDLMIPADRMPKIQEDAPIREALKLMTQGEVRGVVAVLDKGGGLLGSLTDGDLRRHLDKDQNPLESKVSQVMGVSPKTIHGGELASKALFLMEQFSISSLFVTGSSPEGEELNDSGLLGLVHLQDLLKAKI